MNVHLKKVKRVNFDFILTKKQTNKKDDQNKCMNAFAL